VTISSTFLPATNVSAESRVVCMSPCDSPRSRSRNWRNANRPRSRHVKNLRDASPLAKWKIDAPTIIVLSTSKNAAADGSGGTLSACSTSAAADRKWLGTAGLPSDGEADSLWHALVADRLPD